MRWEHKCGHFVANGTVGFSHGIHHGVVSYMVGQEWDQHNQYGTHHGGRYHGKPE